MTNIVQTAGAVAVGSGALLGVSYACFAISFILMLTLAIRLEIAARQGNRKYKMKSETPRTDAAAQTAANVYHPNQYVVPITTARELERELSAMSIKYEQSIFERCNLVLQNKSLLDELTQIKNRRRDA